MKRPGVRELYQELGPMLFARANRVLKDEKAAAEVALEAVTELEAQGALPREELVKRARELVKRRCEERQQGVAFDSLIPGMSKPPKP